MLNQSSTAKYTEGDKICVRDKLKVKVKANGAKTLIAPSKKSHGFSIKAEIAKCKGRVYDILFTQDVPLLSVHRGEIIQNVPAFLFRKQLEFKTLNPDSLRDRDKAIQKQQLAGSLKLQFLERNEQFAFQKAYVPQD